MDSTFTQGLTELPSYESVIRKLRERRDEILRGIEEGTINPNEIVLGELFDLNVALGEAGDAPV